MAHALAIESTLEHRAAVGPRFVPLPASSDPSFPFNPKLVEKSLRRRGIVGPIDDEFIDSIAWANFAVAAEKALKETCAYGPAGAQAYIDDLLTTSIEEARELPADHPLRIVSERALELASHHFAS